MHRRRRGAGVCSGLDVHLPAIAGRHLHADDAHGFHVAFWRTSSLGNWNRATSNYSGHDYDPSGVAAAVLPPLTRLPRRAQIAARTPIGHDADDDLTKLREQELYRRLGQY